MTACFAWSRDMIRAMWQTLRRGLVSGFLGVMLSLPALAQPPAPEPAQPAQPERNPPAPQYALAAVAAIVVLCIVCMPSRKA
jgi:hypothetical protein